MAKRVDTCGDSRMTRNECGNRLHSFVGDLGVHMPISQFVLKTIFSQSIHEASAQIDKSSEKIYHFR